MGNATPTDKSKENYVFCALMIKDKMKFKIISSQGTEFQQFYFSEKKNIYVYGINFSSLSINDSFDIKLVLNNETYTIYKNVKPKIKNQDLFIFKNCLKKLKHLKQISSVSLLKTYFDLLKKENTQKLDCLLNNALEFLNEQSFSFSFFLEIFKHYHTNKNQGMIILSNFLLSKKPVFDIKSKDYLNLFINTFENYKTVPHYLIMLMFYFNSLPESIQSFNKKLFSDRKIEKIQLKISWLNFYKDINYIFELYNNLLSKVKHSKNLIIELDILKELEIIIDFVKYFYFLPQIIKMIEIFSNIFFKEGYSFENKNDQESINVIRQDILLILLLRREYNIPLIIEGNNDKELLTLINENLPKLKNTEILLTFIINNNTSSYQIKSFLKDNQCLENQIGSESKTRKLVLLLKINNCNHVCQEAIIKLFLDRTIQTQKLKKNIYICGTCLPYKTETHEKNKLDYGKNQLPNQLQKYKVEFNLFQCFLEMKNLSTIISKHIYGQEPENKEEKNILVQVFHQAIFFFTSLNTFEQIYKSKDTLIIIYKKLIEKLKENEIDKKKIFLLSIYVVFYLRIPNNQLRKKFEESMDKILQINFIQFITEELKKIFSLIVIPKVIQKTIDLLGILFAGFLCIKCNIPLFISGPPGVGKTTIINILKDFGKFNHDFCYLNHSFIFEHKTHNCSHLDRKQSFQNLFIQCKQKIKNKETIPLLFLDNLDYVNQEEISSLQSLLELEKQNEDKIAFIGVSIKNLITDETSNCFNVFIPEATYSLEQESTQNNTFIEERNSLFKTKYYSLGLNKAKKLLNINQKYEFLVGSHFEEDFNSEHYISNKIDKIKEQIQENKVLILYKMNMLYPMLLDLFAKNYKIIDEQEYVTIGFPIQRLMFINPSFVVIVIADEKENNIQLFHKLKTSIIEIKNNVKDNFFTSFFHDPRNQLINNNLIKQQLINEEIVCHLIQENNSDIDSLICKLSKIIPFGVLFFSDLTSKEQDKIRQSYQKREIFTLNECLQKISTKKFVIFTYSTHIEDIKLINRQTSIGKDNEQKDNKEIIFLSQIHSEEDFLNKLQSFYNNDSSEYLFISLKPKEWKHIISLQSSIDEYERFYNESQLKVIIFIVHLKWTTFNEQSQISGANEYDLNYTEFIPFTHGNYFYILIDDLQYGIKNPNFLNTNYFRKLLTDYLSINIKSIINDLFQSNKIDLDIKNRQKDLTITKSDIINEGINVILQNTFIMENLIDILINKIKTDFPELEELKITNYLEMLLDKITQEIKNIYIYLEKNNALFPFMFNKQPNLSQNEINNFFHDNMSKMQVLNIYSAIKINYIIGLNIPFSIKILDSIETIIKPMALVFYNEQNIEKKKLLMSDINYSLFNHQLISYSKAFIFQGMNFDLFIKDFYKKYLISNGFVYIELSDLEFLLNLIYETGRNNSNQNIFPSIILLFYVYKKEIKHICNFYLQLKKVISNIEELFFKQINGSSDFINKTHEYPILSVFFELVKIAIYEYENSKYELHNVFINSMNLLNSIELTFLSNLKEVKYIKSIANFSKLLSEENDLKEYSPKLIQFLHMNSKTNETQIKTNYDWLIQHCKNNPTSLIISIKEEIERQDSFEYYQKTISFLIANFSLFKYIQPINPFIYYFQLNNIDNNKAINMFSILLENESNLEQVKLFQLYNIENIFYLNQEPIDKNKSKNFRDFYSNITNLSIDSIESIAKVKVTIYNYVNLALNQFNKELPLGMSKSINKITMEGLNSTIKLYFLKCFKNLTTSYKEFFNYKIVNQLIEELNLNNQENNQIYFSNKFYYLNDVNKFDEITEKLTQITKGSNDLSINFFKTLFNHIPTDVLIFYDSITDISLFNLLKKNSINETEYFNLTSFCDDLFNYSSQLNSTVISILKLFLNKPTFLNVIYPIIEKINSSEYENFLMFYKLALMSSCCEEGSYYKNLFTKEAENIIKTSYNPGIDNEYNIKIKNYFYIKYFFEHNDRSKGIDSVWEYSPGFYVCNCGCHYELSQCALPIYIFKCQNCGAEIGGTKHRLVEREGHLRIFQNEKEKEFTLKRTDCNIHDQFIMFKEYEIQCQAEICKLDKPGIGQIDFNYYETPIKNVRQMTQITYRILNILFYSTIYFSSLIEGISQEIIENEFTCKNKKCIEMLFSSYSKLNMELENLQIESTNIFINWLIPKLFTIINKYKYLSTKEERISLENEVEQIIQEQINNYHKKCNEYYNQRSVLKYLEEKNINDKTKEKFPMLDYFTYIPYVNEQILENQILRDPNNEESFPVLYNYFKYFNDTQCYKLQYVLKMNPLVSKMISKFSYKITRKESFCKLIKEIIIDKDEISMLNEFLPYYNELMSDELNYNCLIKLKAEKITLDSKLAYLLNDDGYPGFGLHIAAIYDNFILWQNQFLNSILFYLKETHPLFYLKEQIKENIELQCCSEKEIVNINFPEEYISKLILKYSINKGNKIEYDLYQIEKELGTEILRHKRILSNKQNHIIYQYESFLGDNSSIINDYITKYNQRELSKEEIQKLSPLTKNDFKILFSFQKIINILSKEFLDSNTSIQTALDNLKQFYDFDDQCLEYFKHNKDFNLQSLISIYDYLEEVFIDQHLTQLHLLYKKELKAEQKELILKDLYEHEKNKNNLINRNILCNVVKKFIFRNLLSEREIGNYVPGKYLLEQISYKEDIWPLNLRFQLEKIKKELLNLNNQWKVTDHYSESFYLLLSGK